MKFGIKLTLLFNEFESVELFMNRMLQHEKDNLFTYEYTKQQANVLKFQSLNRIKQWKKII